MGDQSRRFFRVTVVFLLATASVLQPLQPVFAAQSIDVKSDDPVVARTNGESLKEEAEKAALKQPPIPQSSTGNPVDPRTNQLSTIVSKAPERDKHTGALVYSYPIHTPPGRSGLEPNLYLSYNSQNTDNESIVGYGWSVPIASIERLNKRGVENLYSDNLFTSSLSGELVRASGTEASGAGDYAARFEFGDFLKYTLDVIGNKR